uniref:VWFC domain-containing protein n=1 Tax=Astyanax mexicanus TaxID=7994 RepID=A0A8B9HA15_ASTMX
MKTQLAGGLLKKSLIPFHLCCFFLLQNNTSWKPDTCQDCTCHSDVVICRATRCLNPQCDFQRGERLRIPPNKCCPECFPQSSGSCQHRGAVHRHDSQWSESKCSVCTCSLGKVTCVPPACPPLSCGSGQSPYIPAGECCPKSFPCSIKGQLTHTPDGQQWQKNSCTTCVCDRGQSRCHTEKCAPLHCDKMKVKRPGQCCEECASSKGSCQYEGAVRYHGDMWNGTGCEFCTCERGQVLCQSAECARLECPRDKLDSLGRACVEGTSPSLKKVKKSVINERVCKYRMTTGVQFPLFPVSKMPIYSMLVAVINYPSMVSNLTEAQ